MGMKFWNQDESIKKILDILYVMFCYPIYRIYGMLSINIEKIDQFKVNVVLHDLLRDELT